MSKICIKPFQTIEIDSAGNVYTCCPAYINMHNIGNIFTDNVSLDKIWYSDKATEFRKRILAEDFSFCNLELCRQRVLEDNKNGKYNLTPPLPKYITLAYDKECNLQCIFCRDAKIKNDEQTTKIFNEKIDSLLIPLIKEAQIVALSGAGEAFFSKHSRLLIKKLASVNPNILFNINTNGLLFNKNNCEALGINNRINEVFVSLHSLDENLYNQIMLGSNLKVVLRNIKWMAQAQKTGEIKKVTINCAVCDLNYKQIPKLVAFAKKLGIWITISQYCYWETTFGRDYENHAVWHETNPEFNKFVKILKNKNLNYDKCYMSPLFFELREYKNKKKFLHFFSKIIN